MASDSEGSVTCAVSTVKRKLEMIRQTWLESES
jgi:hypothetical protein